MISIDIENLKDASAASASAAAKLEDAAGSLLQITTHQNWQCPNKEKINELILTNRNLINELVDDAAKFNVAIQQVTDEFVSEEKNISLLFEDVEEILSAVLSVETIAAGTVSAIGSGFKSSAASAISSIAVTGAQSIIAGLSGEGDK